MPIYIYISNPIYISFPISHTQTHVRTHIGSNLLQSIQCAFFFARIRDCTLGQLIMVLGRNLLAEQLHMAAACSSDEPAPKKSKQNPAEVDYPALKQLLADRTYDVVSDATIVITATDDLVDKTVATGSQSDAAGMQLMLGLYYNTGLTMSDRVIWKSCIGMEGKFLYIFVLEQGWYIADSIASARAEIDSGFVWVLMYGPLVANEETPNLWPDIPHKLHYPYWAKKFEHAITVSAAFNHVMHLDQEVAILSNKATRAASGSNEPHAMKPVIDTDDDDIDKGEGKGKNSGKDKGQDKDKGKKQQHGGWMPKMAQLISAYWGHDWHYCDKLVGRFTSESPALLELVKKKMKKE